MRTNRNQAASLRAAIEHWRSKGLLDANIASALQNDVEVVPFDWKRLAKYSFWVALICVVIAVGTILADDVLVALLESIFDAPYIVKCFALTALAGTFYWLGARRRAKHPQKVFSNEAILFLGALATGGAIYELGRAFDTGSGHFSILLLAASLIYAALGVYLRSNLIWLVALLSFGSWMGAETGYASGWGAYYLGMNYPLRFVLFGALLTGATLAVEKKSWFEPFFRSSLAMGLLYLFVALWILSIYGNYGDKYSWYQVKQIQLFHWLVLFALVAAGAIFHGLRFDNGMTKGFGITFLFLNLYTRFFEYLWDSVHKAILFAVLGLSFWLLGSRAEKIWHLGETKDR